MTRSEVSAIISRLDSHSEKLDAVRSDVDRLKGGLVVIGLILTGILIPLLSAWINMAITTKGA